MRIRIQTYSPLPDVKAWFVPDAHNVPENISNLKDELCRRVQALKDAQYHGRNLTLLLDDFELLDDNPFSAVRDGDLICIKQLSKPEVAHKSVVPELPHGQKRKRSHISAEHPVQKAVQLKPATPQPHVVKRPQEVHNMEYDSDSSTSSSASSASSTSTSSTSTSSTSSSTSSSEESSAPKPLSSKAATPASTTTKPTSQTIHVPPGLGKPATHSRNNRRRKKREFLKEGASAPPTTTLKGASQANSHPLGPAKAQPQASTSEPASVPLPPSPTPIPIPISFSVKSSSSLKKARTDEASVDGEGSKDSDSTPAPVYVTQDQVMMSSMRNKNKKKGFKLSMSNPIPQKIVFDGTAPTLDHMQVDSHPQAQAQAQPSTSASTSTSASSSSQSLFNSTGPSPHARLVPPSEIQDRSELPSNMFVTSVDVEAGMWGDYSNSNGSSNSNSKAKRKGKKKVRYMEEEMYGDGDGDDSYYADEGANANANEGPSVLDYSGENEGAGSGEPEFDWDRAEKLMASGAPLVTSPGQLKPGVLLGWMELGIDPRTFCPEDMVHVARVVKGPDMTSVKAEVTLRKIRRSVAGDTAFSFLLDSASGEEEEDEETIPWLNVLGSERYKVLNM